MVNYLSEVDILTINARIIQREGEKHQVSHVRDAEALHFLIEQPKQISFGQELYPTFSSKAGILLIKLIKKHVFDDANKRTATIAFLILTSTISPAFIFCFCTSLTGIFIASEEPFFTTFLYNTSSI